MKGLQFYKLFGSGVGEGFTPVLNPNVYAIMAVWDSATDADQNIANSSIFKKYKNRSKENWTLYLKPTRSWGSWDKRNPFEITDDLNQTFPVVALTRAPIKTTKAQQCSDFANANCNSSLKKLQSRHIRETEQRKTHQLPKQEFSPYQSF